MSAAQWVWPHLKNLARQEVGAIGLIALALLVAVVVAVVVPAYWETRPKPEAKPAEPAPLSEKDRRLINDLRAVWNRFGQQTVNTFYLVFNDAIQEVRSRRYWAELLDRYVTELEAAKNELDKAVARDSTASLHDVREAFNRLYRAYRDAMRWFATLEEHGDTTPDNSRRRFDAWKEQQHILQDELERLVQDPDHERTLLIFPGPGVPFEYPAYWRLLREIEECRPQRSRDRALTDGATPSMPDNEVRPHQLAEEEDHGTRTGSRDC